MDSHDPSQNPPPTYVSPQVVVAPAPPAPRWRGGRFLVWMLGLGLLAFMGFGLLMLVTFVSVMSGQSDSLLIEKYHSLDKSGDHKVAVISVTGAIMDVDGDSFIKRQIDKVRQDENVKAVVLRVNSPGGTVTGSDYIYHHLQKLIKDREIPLVVSMGGIAASGGYYVSMAVGDTEDSIFAEPSTWTGSIGVIIPHYNVAGLMERWEIKEDSVKSHRLKQMGSPFREMTPEEQAIFQSLVNDSFDAFKDIVRAGRPKFRNDQPALDAVATGQIFDTKQALANGLVDKQGYIEDAIDRAVELAKLDKKKTKAVRYEKPIELFGGIFGSESARGSMAIEAAALLDMLTPRACYLWTWPVSVTGSGR